ncbi:hypothetical protein NERG_01813 [Nematocida ausubeli]|uniref:Uncharacterized protein n=1 Tax=Nematocida ausubeli (strain ATCC PRA-371 / ERTm2) TaxID=1913371 RepID=H8ZDZ2_NEMA1|nr:hypothetical protein NERG_01813 [Nematocida ausubeli]
MKKHEYHLQLYREKDTKRIYFISGAGLIAGSILGGVQGILSALRRTHGKKRGMEYFAAKSAQRLGSATAIASCAFAVSEHLLSQIPQTASVLARMLE